MTRCAWWLAALAVTAIGCDGSRGPTAPVVPADDTDDGVKLASPEDLADWRQQSPGHVAVIVARDSVDVPSEADGTVQKVLVNRGDRVVKGQALAKIAEDLIRDELRQAKAALKVAKASVRGASSADGKLCRRMRREPDAVPRAEMEAVCARAASASGRRGEAKANVDSAAIQVEKLERMLDKTMVTAPYDGTVSDVYANEGALAKRGDPVVRLLQSDELRVRFAIPIEDKTKYNIGDEIEVALDSTDLVFKAKVLHLSPDVDPTLQMVEGEAELLFESQTDRDKLQVGMATWVKPTAKDEPIVQEH